MTTRLASIVVESVVVTVFVLFFWNPIRRAAIVDGVKAMNSGSDLTVMLHLSSEGGRETAVSDEAQKQVFGAMMEQLKRGTLREYKRIICFDHDVVAKDHELKSGILRVGEGPGTINRILAEHCRLMLETKGCSVFVAPVVFRHFVGLFGTDKACMSVETIDQDTGARKVTGTMFFYDPPNADNRAVPTNRTRHRETHDD